MTVPYERAIERVMQRDEERAAPIVPEERAKAAVGQSLNDRRRASGYQTDQMYSGPGLDRISSKRPVR